MSRVPAFPLPDGWGAPELSEDTIELGTLEVHRVGISVTAEDGTEVLGAAAGLSSPRDRARFELLERVATIAASREARDSYSLLTASGQVRGSVPGSVLFPASPAPDRWQFSRSNGVALHADWPSACESARRELVERDRVLAAWYGETRGEALPHDFGTSALSAVTGYDWGAFVFPHRGPVDHDDLQVVGVFGFPRDEAMPWSLGLAARPTRDDAVAGASAEALQLLAFLWGEPLPASVGAAVGPGMHLDRYQVRGERKLVQRWLAEGHSAHWRRAPAAGAEPAGEAVFVDLTPSWMPDGLRVAKATRSDVNFLVFGDSPWAAHLPPELRLHPVP